MAQLSHDGHTLPNYNIQKDWRNLSDFESEQLEDGCTISDYNFIGDFLQAKQLKDRRTLSDCNVETDCHIIFSAKCKQLENGRTASDYFMADYDSSSSSDGYKQLENGRTLSDNNISLCDSEPSKDGKQIFVKTLEGSHHEALAAPAPTRACGLRTPAPASTPAPTSISLLAPFEIETEYDADWTLGYSPEAELQDMIFEVNADKLDCRRLVQDPGQVKVLQGFGQGPTTLGAPTPAQAPVHRHQCTDLVDADASTNICANTSANTDDWRRRRWLARQKAEPQNMINTVAAGTLVAWHPSFSLARAEAFSVFDNNGEDNTEEQTAEESSMDELSCCLASMTEHDNDGEAFSLFDKNGEDADELSKWLAIMTEHVKEMVRELDIEFDIENNFGFPSKYG